MKSLAYGQLGRSYIALEKYDKALDSYTKAVQYTQKPNNIASHINAQGFVHFKANRLDKARETYDKALKFFAQNRKVDSIQYWIVQSNIASVDFKQGLTASGLERLYALEQSFCPKCR